jgi:hypothetical protein
MPGRKKDDRRRRAVQCLTDDEREILLVEIVDVITQTTRAIPAGALDGLIMDALVRHASGSGPEVADDDDDAMYDEEDQDDDEDEDEATRPLVQAFEGVPA